MNTYGLDPFSTLVDVVLRPQEISAVSEPTNGGRQKVPLMPSKSHGHLILNADHMCTCVCVCTSLLGRLMKTGVSKDCVVTDM